MTDGAWISTFITLLTVGANPDWPPTNTTLSGTELREPRFWPDDPEYAPWSSDGPCTGQLSFYSYPPSCAPWSSTDSTGVALDGAWLYSIGSPSITLAIIGDSIDLSHQDLAFKVRLNPEEIPSLPDESLDTNQDGVVTVHDFSRASTDELPTPDTVTDQRLLARPDGGDTNQNGYIDPLDIIEIFADGEDDDGNGLADDIAGWNFLERTPQPNVPTHDRTTAIAQTAAARTNDGFGKAGACPLCTIVPIQVGSRGLASTDNVALALLYAQSRSASVAILDTAIPGTTLFLEEAYAATEDQLLTVIASGASSYPSQVTAIPEPSSTVATVFATARSPANQALSCTRSPPTKQLYVPGFTCPNIVAAGVVGGLAGLMHAVAPRAIRPATIAHLMAATAPNGRLNARAAVEAAAAEQQAIPVRWIRPKPSVVLDPTFGLVTGEVEIMDIPQGGARWSVSIASATTAPLAFVEVRSGVLQPSPSFRMRLELPIAGLLPDPTRPPADPDAKAFWLRLDVTPLAEDVVPTSALRRIHVDADLDRLPGFPVDLGAGAVGGPRIVDVDQDGQPEIWVALIDGRIARITHTGAIQKMWAPRRPSDALPVNAWAKTTIRHRSIARLSAPTAVFESTPGVVASVASDGVLTLIEGEQMEHYGSPTRPLSTYPAGWTAPALGVKWSPRSAYAVTWLAPDGLRTMDELVWPISSPSPAVAVELQPLSSNPIFWVTTNDRLLNSNAVDVAIPDLQAAPFGLNQLRLRRSPVIMGEDAALLEIALPTDHGFLTWNGTRFRSTPGPRDGRTLAGTPISAREREVIFWWIMANESNNFLVPRPWSPNSDRMASLAQVDPVPHEVLIADVDGATEEWIFAGDPFRLWAISTNGKQAAGWPKLTGQPVWGTPSVGDLTKDDTAEIAAVTRSGLLYVWRTRGDIQAASWGSERHDVAATGNATNDREGRAIEPGGCWCLHPSRSPHGLELVIMMMLISRWGIRRMLRAT